MIYKSSDYGCLSEIIIISSMLSVSNPFVRSKETNKESDEKKAQFSNQYGDHLTLLNL